MGRIGQPREVALAALWPCFDLASYTTGAVVSADGSHTAR
jgi:NAD(P)-dependent dehydrogenase (short-subunit alcohol dehydrogenase family)